MNTLIKNASLVNEGRVLVCDVLIQGEIIKEISKQIEDFPPNTTIIDYALLLIQRCSCAKDYAAIQGSVCSQSTGALRAL